MKNIFASIFGKRKPKTEKTKPEEKKKTGLEEQITAHIPLEELAEIAAREIVASGCGCSRHSARNFYNRHADTCYGTALAVYSVIRRPLQSYCETTRSSTSYNNVRTIRHTLNLSYSLLPKIKKGERLGLIENQASILNDLLRNARSMNSEIEQIPMLMEIAANYSKEDDHASAVMLLYNAGLIANEKNQDFAKVIYGLIERYRPKAINEITKEKIPIEEKKKKLHTLICESGADMKKTGLLLLRLNKIGIYSSLASAELIESAKESYDCAIRPFAETIKEKEKKAREEIDKIKSDCEKSRLGYETRISKLESCFVDHTADIQDIQNEKSRVIDRLRKENAAAEREYVTKIAEIENKTAENLAKPKAQVSHLEAELEYIESAIKSRTLIKQEYKNLSTRIREKK